MRSIKFAGDTKASVAIEFALVCPALFLLTMMWLETGWVILQQQALDNATRVAARLIRTGQSPSQSTFNAKICSVATSLLTCSLVQSRVQAASSFSSMSTSVTATSSGAMSDTSYSIGSSGSDIVAQAGYTHTIYTPFVSNFLGSNGYILLVSTVTFQNEPD